MLTRRSAASPQASLGAQALRTSTDKLDTGRLAETELMTRCEIEVTSNYSIQLFPLMQSDGKTPFPEWRSLIYLDQQPTADLTLKALKGKASWSAT